MEKTFAKIISYVLEPFVVFPVMLFLLVVGKTPDQAIAAAIVTIVGLGIPMLVTFWEYLNDSSPDMVPTRRERNHIYLTGIFSFTFTSILFGTALVPNVIWFYISMIFAVYMACMYLVNLYFDKASFHLSTYTLAVIVLTIQVNNAFSIFLVFLPFLVWSRLKLHRHTWAELMWGLVIGLAVGMLTWAI